MTSSLFTQWFNILKPHWEAKCSIKMILLDSQVTYEPVWYADVGCEPLNYFDFNFIISRDSGVGVITWLRASIPSRGKSDFSPNSLYQFL